MICRTEFIFDNNIYLVIFYCLQFQIDITVAKSISGVVAKLLKIIPIYYIVHFTRAFLL